MSLDFCRPTSEYVFLLGNPYFSVLAQVPAMFRCGETASPVFMKALSIKAIIVLKHASTSRYKTAVVQTDVLAVM